MEAANEESEKPPPFINVKTYKSKMGNLRIFANKTKKANQPTA